MSAATPGDARFLTTRWSVVLAAGDGASPRREAALDDLARAYWFPLYAYARRSGLAREEAADAVQDHFARILGRDDLAAVDPRRGRFRAWLLTGLRNGIATRRERALATKRGGAVGHVSIDADAAESRLELADPRPKEILFEREWARTVLDRATSRLRDEQAHARKAELYDALAPALAADDDAPKQAEVAASLGLTKTAVKVALHRMRKRLGELIRDEVAGTLGPGEDVEAEIRELIGALGR